MSRLFVTFSRPNTRSGGSSFRVHPSSLPFPVILPRSAFILSASGMKPEILLIARIFPPTVVELEREYTVHDLTAASDPAALLGKIGASVRGAVTSGLVGCDRARMEALPKLEIVASFGTPNG